MEGEFKFRTTITRDAARQLSPTVLAFVGDAVFTLYVREKVTLASDCKPSALQKQSVQWISAHGQADLSKTLMPLLTEEEKDIFLRGRNAKKNTRSKNATVGEYNTSTGFEAMLGFLYLTGNLDRIDELLIACEKL